MAADINAYIAANDDDFVAAMKRVRQAAGDTGKQVEASFKAQRFAASNLAYQLHDIGVGLASGQSPFMVMVQQGAQVTDVLNDAASRGASLKSVLVEAFTGLINPISLATFAVIGLGGALVEAFSSIGGNAKSSEDVLKEFNALVSEIGRASKESGDNIKKMLDQPESWSKIQNDADKVAKDLQSKLDDATKDIRYQFRELKALVEQSPGLMSAAAQKMVGSILEMSAAFDQGKTGVDQLDDALNNLKSTDPVPPLLDTVISKLLTASDTAKQLYDQMNAIKKLGSIEDLAKGARPLTDADIAQRLQTQTRLANNAKDKLVEGLNEQSVKLNSGPYGDFNIPTPADRPSLLDYDPNKTSGRSSTRLNDYQRGVQLIQNRTKALQAQAAAQAGINPLIDDYGRSVATAQAKQQLLNAAEKAGKTITPELKAQIDRLAEGYGNAQAAINKATKAQELSRQQLQYWKNTAKDALGTFVSDLEQGKSAWQAMGDAAMSVLDKIIDKIENQLVDALFSAGNAGGGFGGFLSSIFGGGFGGSSQLLSALGHGGIGLYARGGVANELSTAE